MSHLSEELKRQMELHGVNGPQLAERSQISASQIYKWSNNDQTSINAKQLDAVSEALSQDAMDHARLLVAHLEDERVGCARDLVRIELDTVAELKDRPRPRTKGEKAIHFLVQQRLENREVNDLLIELARCLGADL